MKSRTWWIAALVAGILLVFGPLWGAVATALGMTRAFRTLGKSGVADPHVLSAAIGEVLVSGVVGIAMCPLGIALVVTSIIFLNRQSRRLPPAIPRNLASPQ